MSGWSLDHAALFAIPLGGDVGDGDVGEGPPPPKEKPKTKPPTTARGRAGVRPRGESDLDAFLRLQAAAAGAESDGELQALAPLAASIRTGAEDLSREYARRQVAAGVPSFRATLESFHVGDVAGVLARARARLARVRGMVAAFGSRDAALAMVPAERMLAAAGDAGDGVGATIDPGDLEGVLRELDYWDWLSKGRAALRGCSPSWEQESPRVEQRHTFLYELLRTLPPRDVLERVRVADWTLKHEAGTEEKIAQLRRMLAPAWV